MMILARPCAPSAFVRSASLAHGRCVDGKLGVLLLVKGELQCELAEARLYAARAGLARARSAVAAARAAYIEGEWCAAGESARAAYYASLDALELAEQTLPLRRGEAHIARCRIERWVG